MPPKVMIATPAYDGTLCVAYVQGLIETERALRDAGISLSLHFTMQNSLVMHARNEIVADFMRTDCTDLIFVDSDIGWRGADVLRLLSYDLPMVAGAYRRKTEALSYVVVFPDGGRVLRDRGTGLVEASRVGAGFLRLRRDALDRMIAAHPDLRYQPPQRPADSPCHALFDTSMIDGELVGEDWTFCARWRALGGRLWVDPEIALLHVGKHAYTGVLRDALQPHPT
ncbi:MAG: hypothetical protein JSR21_05340 [Proteobacteria bacterium]|nr:hypothetical protein [Pseudomonadota bacterium]